MNQPLPPCPACSSEYTYEMGTLLVCPECANEWSPAGTDSVDEDIIRDSVGNILTDGDTVTVIKSLKVKGSPTGIKAGTKVRNIRLVNTASATTTSTARSTASAPRNSNPAWSKRFSRACDRREIRPRRSRCRLGLGSWR